MSLIYQALKQSEQHASASSVPAARKTAFAPVQGAAPSPITRNRLGLGVAVACGGVLVGYLLTTGSKAPTAQASQRPVAPASAPAPLYDPAPEQAQSPALNSLPKADLPLPTASPRLRMDLNLPKPAAVLPAPTEAIPPASKPSATVAPARSPAMPVAAVVDASPKPMLVTASSPPTEDVGRLFEAMNQALASGDTALAQKKLQGIQSGLPESSVARLRAEAWFAHQTSDLDSASRIYRRLLEKIPGDELTSVNLASIEKKRQRPELAKEVLAKALRQNPSSTVLRSAADQLAQAEVRQ